MSIRTKIYQQRTDDSDRVLTHALKVKFKNFSLWSRIAVKFAISASSFARTEACKCPSQTRIFSEMSNCCRVDNRFVLSVPDVVEAAILAKSPSVRSFIDAAGPCTIFIALAFSLHDTHCSSSSLHRLDDLTDSVPIPACIVFSINCMTSLTASTVLHP